MQRKLGPLPLIFTICLLLVLTVAGFWIAFLPQRMAAQLGTSIEGALPLGFAHSGPAIMGWNNGLEAKITGVRIANAGLPETFSLAAKSIRLPAHIGLAGGDGTTQNLLLEEPLITADAGISLVGASAAAHKQDLAAGGSQGQRIQLRVSSGEIRLQDASSGSKVILADVNGSLQIDSQSAVLLHVTGLLNGVHTTLRLEADDAMRLLAGGSPADVLVSSDKGELRFSGRAGWGQGLALDGRIFLASRKSGDMLAWLGLPSALAPAASIELESAASISKSRLEMPDLVMKVGTAAAKGRLTLEARPEHLAIDAALQGEKIDLAALWPGSKDAGGWSDKPFTWLPWRAVAGTIKINAEQMKLGSLQLDKAQLSTSLVAETARINLTTSDGSMTAQLELANGSQTRMRASAAMQKVNAGEIARSLLGGNWLTGKLGGTADVAATGHSVAGLLSTLSGSFDLKLQEAGISGYSVKDLLATPGKGWRAATGDHTADMSAALVGKIDEGVASFTSSALNVAGLKLPFSGEIDILRRDLAIDVKQKAAKDLPTLIGIQGVWDDPVFGDTSARAARVGTAQEAAPN